MRVNLLAALSSISSMPIPFAVDGNGRRGNDDAAGGHGEFADGPPPKVLRELPKRQRRRRNYCDTGSYIAAYRRFDSRGGGGFCHSASVSYLL